MIPGRRRAHERGRVSPDVLRLSERKNLSNFLSGAFALLSETPHCDCATRRKAKGGESVGSEARAGTCRKELSFVPLFVRALRGFSATAPGPPLVRLFDCVCYFCAAANVLIRSSSPPFPSSFSASRRLPLCIRFRSCPFPIFPFSPNFPLPQNSVYLLPLLPFRSVSRFTVVPFPACFSFAFCVCVSSASFLVFSFIFRSTSSAT